MNRLSVLIFLFSIGTSICAQVIPEYDMQNLVVTDCDGILFDSGGQSGIYDNNENFVFTIQGLGPVSFQFFGQFCLENNLDFVTLYNGPNIGSPLLAGPFTGTNLPGGSFTANSGFLTVHMTSDNSVTYCGFSGLWNVQAPPPVPPAISVNALPACGATGFTLNFSTPVPCDALIDATLALTANGPVQVTDLAPIGCVNNLTSSASVTLGAEMDYNCTYNLLLEIGLPDVCDSIWNFEVPGSFLYNLCPVNAEVLVPQNPVCLGGCTTIDAQVAATCFNYTYQWSHGLPPTAGPHNICPPVTDTYTVTITEVQTGIQTVFSALVEVVEIDFALTPSQVCSNESAFALPANPPGGTWSGPGIDPNDATLFDPGAANTGFNTLTYDFAGCTATVDILVNEINAGGVIAACPGTPPFQLTGQPAGGTWSGPNLLPGDFFDPNSVGQFVFTYSVNGCTDNLTINVDAIAITDIPAEICQSEPEFSIVFDPIGGTWSGPGLVDGFSGTFNPRDMPAGNVTVTYTAQGCSQNFIILVKEINVGPKFLNACPDNAPFVPFPGFAPPGGTWAGNGILNNFSGLFAPSVAGNDTWNDLIYTAPNGCTDTIHMYVRQTEILTPIMFMCEDGPDILLDFDNVESTPWGGTWTGPGVVNLGGGDYLFSPAQSGIGTFTLVYTVNNCVDDMTMVVHPNQLNIPDQQFCSNEPPVIFGTPQSEGGTWSGPGIHPQTGEYTPANGQPGTATITWTSPAGCTDSFEVTLELFQPAQITALDSVYCFINQSFDAGLLEPGGVFTGGDSPSTFNPATAGAGVHQVIYTIIGQLCNSSDTLDITVHPELTTQFDVTALNICPGQSSTMTVVASGGQPGGQYAYSWDNGLFPVSQHTVSPIVTTTYTVTTSDGCSDPVTDTVTISVDNNITLEVTTGGELCFGAPNFAFAEASPAGNYQYTWQTNPPTTGQMVEVPAGTVVQLLVINLDDGCQKDTLVLVPSQPPVIANFSITPNVECVPHDAVISILDLSQNATLGVWTVGDQTFPYVSGQGPTLDLESGIYSVTLIAENDKGCKDTASVSLCVLDESLIFLPDIFSPNNDGNNDILFVRARNVQTMTFAIYNRWGEKVFESARPQDGWDGDFRGKPSPSGAYAFWLSVTFVDNSVQEFKGTITLVR